MTVRAWRIVKAHHAAAAFSGEGAKETGGRWNSAGVPVVYVAGSISSAMLEILVHVQSPKLLNRYVRFEVQFDESLVTALDPKVLSHKWRKSPSPKELQQMGDDWFTAAVSAVLCVPSAIVPDELNYLLNPKHRDFPKIVIGSEQPMAFDSRLAGK